jgi:hypothetical protein
MNKNVGRRNYVVEMRSVRVVAGCRRIYYIRNQIIREQQDVFDFLSKIVDYQINWLERKSRFARRFYQQDTPKCKRAAILRLERSVLSTNPGIGIR